MKSAGSSPGCSSSRETYGMATAAHDDDRMAYQGVEGVFALRKAEGRMVADTPGRRSHSTTGAQKASG
jgi:hypothetical protein